MVVPRFFVFIELLGSRHLLGNLEKTGVESKEVWGLISNDNLSYLI